MELFTIVPEDIVYNILTYAELPLNVAPTLCRTISPLCTAARNFASNDSLWEIILGAYVNVNNDDGNVGSNALEKRSRAQSSRRQRRESKRLRRTTAKEDVIHAHCVLRDQTELAMQEIADMAISKTPHPLTLARLRNTLNTYGPHLNINQRSSTGSTILVDCCRARYVTENVILKCVRELIEFRGASPATYAVEGSCHIRKRRGKFVSPLVVVAARGMPTVVQYLLGRPEGVKSTEDAGTSRFRLYSNPAKSVGGTYTPLEFARVVRNAEVAHGATPAALKSLDRCIRILEISKAESDLMK